MRYVVVSPTTSVDKIRQVSAQHKQSMFPVVTSDNRYLGYILMDDLMEHPAAHTAGEVLAEAIRTGLPRIACVHREDSFDDAMTAIHAEGLPFIPVIDYDSHFIGTLDSSSGRGRLRYYYRVGR